MEMNMIRAVAQEMTLSEALQLAADWGTRQRRSPTIKEYQMAQAYREFFGEVAAEIHRNLNS